MQQQTLYHINAKRDKKIADAQYKIKDKSKILITRGRSEEQVKRDQAKKIKNMKKRYNKRRDREIEQMKDVGRVQLQIIAKKINNKDLGPLRKKSLFRFQKLRRLQCADQFGYCTCCTCNKRVHYKLLDGGHCISAIREATAFNPKNVHAQCIDCNRHNNGMRKKYIEYIDMTYGDGTYEQMLIESKQTIVRTAERYESMIINCSKQIGIHLRRIGEK